MIKLAVFFVHIFLERLGPPPGVVDQLRKHLKQEDAGSVASAFTNGDSAL
jgi:hypothetical protein